MNISNFTEISYRQILKNLKVGKKISLDCLKGVEWEVVFIDENGYAYLKALVNDICSWAVKIDETTWGATWQFGSLLYVKEKDIWFEKSATHSLKYTSDLT